jgi:hypothetical protein
MHAMPAQGLFKTFSADKASPNARFHDTLEYG